MTAMDKGEAIELLLRRSQVEETKENLSICQGIVERLGYHVLAIDQAGAYISQGISLELYLERYEKQKRYLMSKVAAFTIYKRKLATDAEKETALTVFTTRELSLALIQGDDIAKREKRYFLALLAFFNGTDVPDELFKAYQHRNPSWMSSCFLDGDWKELGFEDMLKELRDLLLLQSLQITSSGTRLSIHPLIQDWARLRENSKSPEYFATETILILGDFLEDNDTNAMTLDLKQVTLSQLDAVAYHFHEYIININLRESENLAESIENVARFYNSQGRYESAEEMHRQTLKLRKVLGPEHPDTLMSMENVALALFNQGKYAEAEAMHRQTLEKREKVLGPEHPDTLTSMNEVAVALSSRGKHAEAEAMHRQTLEKRKKVSGPEHPYTLTSMSNVAMALSRQGKHAEAEDINRQTLEKRKKALSPEHPDTLMSMNNLAVALSEQGKYAEAEDMNRQTLEKREKVLGPEHPDTLMSMNNLAVALSEQGKYAEAEAMNRQTLGKREKVLGLEHPHTLMSMNDLAVVLCYQGKYAEAETIYKKGPKPEEDILGL